MEHTTPCDPFSFYLASHWSIHNRSSVTGAVFAAGCKGCSDSCPAQCPISAMILQEMAKVHQVMVDLCQVHERVAQMSVRAVSKELGMEGEEVGSHHVKDCNDYIRDG